ncbi:MAG TPA: ABC transporter ATP-binding protein [Thermodesulfovibrionales bacterium]|nr:ABC transporter ATP-binding protein [Thermodesulfovibrionales bacterium]
MGSNKVTYTSGEAYHSSSKRDIYKKCVQLLLEHKKQTLLLVIFGISASLSRAGIMYLLNAITSLSVGTTTWPLVTGYLFALLAVCITSYGFTYLANLKSQDVIREMQVSLIYKACSILCTPTYSLPNTTDRLDLMLLLRQDVRSVRNISLNLINIAMKFANVGAIYVPILFLSWKIGLSIPILLMPVLWLIIKTNTKVAKKSLEIREHILKNAGTTGKFLKSLPYIRLYDSRNFGPSIVSRMMHERLIHRLSIARLRYFAIFLSGIAGSIGVIAIIGIAAYSGLNIRFQEVIPALVGFFMVQQAIGGIIEASAKNNENLPIARHYFNKMSSWQHANSEDKGKDLPSIKSIEFKETKFQCEPQQVTGWNLKLERDIYCLVSRKMPIFNRIIRNLTQSDIPLEGQILINGEDYRNYSRISIYNNFGLLTQGTPIFPLTVKENIMLASKEATEAGFEKLDKLFDIKQTFSNFEKGIDTDLRERESQLSEMQEIMIAVSRLMTKEVSLYFIDMHILRKLPEKYVNTVINHLLSRKNESIILLKPAVLEDLDYCDRIIFFKANDLCIDASLKDLNDGVRRKHFYINPHPDVCGLKAFSESPERCATFERAVFGFRGFIDGLKNLYNDGISDGDKSVNEDSDKLVIEVDVEEELEEIE